MAAINFSKKKPDLGFFVQLFPNSFQAFTNFSFLKLSTGYVLSSYEKPVPMQNEGWIITLSMDNKS